MQGCSGHLCSGQALIIDTVEMASELTRMKARKHSFSYYDTDDIGQEIWLMVHEASGRFDPTKTKKPLSFFNVHTENRLNNLRRDRRIIDDTNLVNTPIMKEDNSFEEQVAADELRAYMIAKMPPSLLESFDRMINYGGEGVSQYMKTKVRAVVARLMERYRND